VQVALREELARTQEIASKLDAMYKLAEEEAAQYRVQFRAQEDDRQHLVRCAAEGLCLGQPTRTRCMLLKHRLADMRYIGRSGLCCLIPVYTVSWCDARVNVSISCISADPLLYLVLLILAAAAAAAAAAGS
jgi:hypothetical protein